MLRKLSFNYIHGLVGPSKQFFWLLASKLRLSVTDFLQASYKQPLDVWGQGETLDGCPIGCLLSSPISAPSSSSPNHCLLSSPHNPPHPLVFPVVHCALEAAAGVVLRGGGCALWRLAARRLSSEMELDRDGHVRGPEELPQERSRRRSAATPRPLEARPTAGRADGHLQKGSSQETPHH